MRQRRRAPRQVQGGVGDLGATTDHVEVHAGAQALRIVKRNVKRIVGGGVFTFDSNVGGDGRRQSEKNQRVINQMRRNVEKDSATRTRGLTPGSRLELRAISVVSRFEPHDAAQRAGLC